MAAEKFPLPKGWKPQGAAREQCTKEKWNRYWKWKAKVAQAFHNKI